MQQNTAQAQFSTFRVSLLFLGPHQCLHTLYGIWKQAVANIWLNPFYSTRTKELSNPKYSNRDKLLSHITVHGIKDQTWSHLNTVITYQYLILHRSRSRMLLRTCKPILLCRRPGWQGWLSSRHPPIMWNNGSRCAFFSSRYGLYTLWVENFTILHQRNCEEDNECDSDKDFYQICVI